MASSQILRGVPICYRCVSSAAYCSRLQCAGGTSKFALPPLAFQNRNVSLLKRASQRAALSRQKPNIGWLPRRRFGGIAAPSKENHVRMVLGSGGQQQKSSQQGPSKVPTWHPLEDVAPRCQDEPVSQEGKVRGLLPAECARTVVETNEDGVLFTRLFPESHSEGLDLAYVTDDRGDIYFEVDGIQWDGGDAQYLEQEDVTVVVGYGGYDESGAVDEEDEDLSDFMFSDSDEDDSDDDSDDEDWEMLDEYLDMLRSRGVPVEDMSVESFGTLGAYGGFKTLETVHPLDFAIRLSDAVDAQPHPELERPQARVTLRGVVELVSPDEERRVRKEWLKRGYLAKEDEVHEAAASLLEELVRQEEREEEGEEGDQEAAQAARERADAALEQLRRDLQRPETRAGGSGKAASLFRKPPSSVEGEAPNESGADLSAGRPVSETSTSGSTGLETVQKGEDGGAEESTDLSEQKPKFNIGALLRRRLKDLKGFPRPGRSRGEEKQGLEAEGKELTGLAVGSEEWTAPDGEAISEGEVDRIQEDLEGPVRIEREKGAPGGESPETDPGSRIDTQAELSRPGTGGVSQDQDVACGVTVSEKEVPKDPLELEASRAKTTTAEASAPSSVESLEDVRSEAVEQVREDDPEGLGHLEPDAATNSVEGVRQDRGPEASTSGSETQNGVYPPTPNLVSPDLGGLSRWLSSLESESPIIWDQVRGRLWLGSGISASSGDLLMTGVNDGLGNGGSGLEGVLWGDGEEDVAAFWRDDASGEDESEEEEEEAGEGAPLYRLKVTSVCYTSSSGVEWNIDASEYADAQPDVLCEASATLMDQVNHAGHKVARALVRLCKRTRGLEVDDASMVAVDRYGFDLRVSQGTEMKTIRVSFPEVALDEHHAMVLLEDMMWLNKKPDKKLFQFRRSALRRQMLDFNDLDKTGGL